MKQYKRLVLIIIIGTFILPLSMYGENNPNRSGFYFGTNLGWASTDWSLITTSPKIGNLARAASPIGAKDAGLAGGLFVGYQFTSRFAVEAAWNRYTESDITLAQVNEYTFKKTTFPSRTWSTNLTTRYFVYLNNSKTFSIVPEVGLNYTHRSDFIASKGAIGGLFGLGVEYELNQHLITGLRFQYATGMGKAEVRPLDDYVPFLQQVFVTVAYKL